MAAGNIHTTGTSWHDSNRGVSIFISIYVCLYLVVVYLSKKLHESPQIAQYLPEAGMVILIGLLAGGIAHVVANTEEYEMAGQVAESVLSFDSTVFFIVLLPPIIFNSGYHLHRGLLLRYFTPICLLAFVGTMVSMVLVAVLLYGVCQVLEFSPTFNELLAFGALISATDPVSTLAVFSAKKVDPQLFYLLSGESLLNDAVGLVLFEAFAHLVELEGAAGAQGQKAPLGQEILQVLLDVALNFGGSLLLGTLLGLLTAYALKQIDLRHTPLLELSAYALIMYAPFCLAELCRLSGIVTVLFTGLAARRYAEPNLSRFTSESSDTIFRLVAHVTETVIFLELGLSVITILKHGFNVIFVSAALGACLISRALNVYPICLTYNLYQRIRYGAAPPLDPESTSSSPSVSRRNSADDPVSPSGEQPLEDTEASLEAHYEASEDDVYHHNNKSPAMSFQGSLIPRRTTHFLFLSGLRGAVSYGLAKMFPDENGNKVTFEVTTMLIVLITTFVFGGFTDKALRTLEIPVGVNEETFMESLKQDAPATPQSWWHRFESTRICPLVLRDYKPPAIDTDDGDFIYQEQIEIQVQENDDNDDEGTGDKKGRLRWSIFDFGQ